MFSLVVDFPLRLFTMTGGSYVDEIIAPTPAFCNLSENAAYKINNLIKKGYLNKVRSENDRREDHLEVTEKYRTYYNISYNYMNTVMERIANRFSPEEISMLEQILDITSEELNLYSAMPPYAASVDLVKCGS